jgi:hypothetical protein
MSLLLDICGGCYLPQIVGDALKRGHRTVKILIVLLGDVVQPVPGACKLSGHTKQWEHLLIAEPIFAYSRKLHEVTCLSDLLY